MKYIALIMMAVFIVVMSAGCIDNEKAVVVPTPTPTPNVTVVTTILPTDIQTKNITVVTTITPRPTIPNSEEPLMKNPSAFMPKLGDDVSDSKNTLETMKSEQFNECIKTKSYDYCHSH